MKPGRERLVRTSPVPVSRSVSYSEPSWVDVLTMLYNIYSRRMGRASNIFLAHCLTLLFSGILIVFSAVTSGCVDQHLFYTWSHALQQSSPAPLIWRSNWPVMPGQWLPIEYYISRDHKVKAVMQPSSNAPIFTEWGTFDEPRPASVSSGLSPGSTVVRMTFPEGSQEYLVDAATGLLSVVPGSGPQARQPSARQEQ